MVNKNPKILVCTVGSWSTRNGSDTMASLVKDYNPSQLACVYIRADKSDSPICSEYYHIFEHRVVKSVFNKQVATGEAFSVNNQEVVGAENDQEYHDEVKRYGFYKRIRSWWLILVREILWKMGRWNTNEFNSFLRSFSPDVVLFPIEGYIHFNRITEYIVKTCKPSRVIGYMWDDNFTYKQHPYSLGYKVHRFWLRKGVKRLVNLCNTVFAISPKTKREVDSFFGINSVLLTKPVLSMGKHSFSQPQVPIKMLYTGKLNLGRDKALASIVDAIKSINKESQKVVLDIYTNTPLSPKMINRIVVSGSSNLHGFIPQTEVIKEQQKADVLLFVEALSGCDLSARLSFSTKITDYLSAGKCIWAVGNEDLGPIEYLREENAAIVSTTVNGIKDSLERITKEQTISQYAQKAYDCGVNKHKKDIIKKRFQKAVFE